MNAERFAAILEAYGADPARWPEAERADAQAYAAANAGALPAMNEARVIDAMLAYDAPHPPSDLLARRILAARARVLAAARPVTWRPLAALAACAVFGVIVGYGVAQRAPQQGAAEIVLDSAFADFDEWDEG